MNSRQRVICALEHKQPDRVPLGLRYDKAVQRRLEQHFGVDAEGLFERVGEDLRTVRPTCPAAVSEVRYADPTVQIDDNGDLIDIWGVPFREMHTDMQSYVEQTGRAPLADCTGIEQLDDYPWPDAGDWDYSNIDPLLEQHADKCTWGHCRGFFEIACMMRGMDRFLMDLAADPDFACALLDRIAEFLYEKSRRTLEIGRGRFVLFEYNDDLAGQSALFISPAAWRRYIKPRVRRFFDLFRKHGAAVRYHSCGSCCAIIPDLIEIGMDVLNPVQPLAADMDPFRLKDQFGDRLTFHGGIDTQQFLPNARPDEVYDHTRRLIDHVGRNGGLILSTGHYIQADVPFENIFALIRAATGKKLN